MEQNSTKIYTVLLVDDQKEFLEFAKELLSRSPNFIVVGEADSGERALAMLPALYPDLLVLDVQMPGIGGFEAALQALKALPEIRVILISGFEDPQYRRLARAVGAAGFLPKKELSAKAILEILQQHQGDNDEEINTVQG